ncbi:MAG: delta-1-piperideine-6-carboxylate dehydrogenase [Gammaproteobacteria bacterium TMED234]|nr:MAG: delta-1-piperideine-6-carboxylate dehydrogenase [Gammaproteobacteria bacterium TMED234]|tara:strand:- start:785 stop:2155 length:1371 start_codon:yes stop_codon:yes gene_type:complete
MTNNFDSIVKTSKEVSLRWRSIPAPQRGEFIRQFGEELRLQKEALAETITKEARKIKTESLGEVQEAIDMCDFAVGLSRQLYGLTMPSERPKHRLQELWHPLGVVGCITAFNFPMAVFAWNFCLAAVCGNSIIWKPSPHSNDCAKGIKEAWDKVSGDFSDLILILEGGNEEAISICKDNRIALVSATGSTQMGKELAPIVSARLGKLLLELGGNNAAIVCPSANLDLTIKGIAFSACGTTGQRCTSLRRLFVHNTIYDDCVKRLEKCFDDLVIGCPSKEDSQIGPLISKDSYNYMQKVLDSLKSKGIEVIGGERLEIESSTEYYVQPALVLVDDVVDEMLAETFAPILYVKKYDDIKDAIHMQNNVSQGLSSSIFTNDMRESELFLSESGSDCGIANVNIGTSGAEIGGAFGGEKDTGGGRESGSDAWKNYMRRVTATVNYGEELPLAQGVEFDES